MTKLQVFDPPMCCSTGVCGPKIDPALPRFASDLEWLKQQGVEVERFNLAKQPGEFAKNEAVKAALTEDKDCLPLILVDGRIVSRGAYPTRAELAGFAGLAAAETEPLYSPAVAELVAIGAAIASNCKPCLKYHCDKARELGVSEDDMLLAIQTAQTVKQASAHIVLEAADHYLNLSVKEAAPEESCCGAKASSRSKSKCC